MFFPIINQSVVLILATRNNGFIVFHHYVLLFPLLFYQSLNLTKLFQGIFTLNTELILLVDS